MKYVAFALLVVLASPVQAGPGMRLSDSENNKVEGADVRLLSGGRIVGKVDPYHMATSSDIAVRESENCEFRKVSNTEVRLGQRCEFLSGVFTYAIEGQRGVKQQVVLGFTATRQGASEVFMTSAPFIILAK